jgi:hypothetical protein
VVRSLERAPALDYDANMREPNRTKRRILTAGAGAAVFTALEGLACGNPVEPGYYNGPISYEPPASRVEQPAGAAVDAGADAAADAEADAAVDAGADAP